MLSRFRTIGFYSDFMKITCVFFLACYPVLALRTIGLMDFRPKLVKALGNFPSQRGIYFRHQKKSSKNKKSSKMNFRVRPGLKSSKFEDFRPGLSSSNFDELRSGLRLDDF